jgi:energy-converting hydrogenase Eha subunit A
MSETKASTSSGMGCGLLAVLLTVLFVGLKLTGFITWSWLWVISPIPILIVGSIVIFFTIVGVGLAVAALAGVVAAVIEHYNTKKRLEKDQTMGAYIRAAERAMKNVTPKK